MVEPMEDTQKGAQGPRRSGRISVPPTRLGELSDDGKRYNAERVGDAMLSSEEGSVYASYLMDVGFLSVQEALKEDKIGVQEALMAEMNQMVSKDVFRPVSFDTIRDIGSFHHSPS
jgi:hypothetical protein